jgi:hypothetical protein
MSVRKEDNRLRGDRTPAYVGRETGAAELEISPNTWDRWVKEGIIPPSCETFPDGKPRWRWMDVDRKLSGKPALVAANDDDEAAIKGAAFFGSAARNRNSKAA